MIELRELTMKSLMRISLLTVCFGLCAGAAMAQDDDYAMIRAVVSQHLGKKVTEIKPSPVPGLYMVMAPPVVLFMSKDGRYVLDGNLIDLKTRTNVGADERASSQKVALSRLNEKDMIIYKPKKVKHVVTVFTDIDCGYCRKLHSQMAQYNKLGIEIRYLAFPRAGIGSSSYYKAVSVWCAKDRKKAMNEAKTGAALERKSCANPVAKEYQLAQELGINGTPAMMLEDGEIFPGYAPPEKLSQVLDKMHPTVSMK